MHYIAVDLNYVALYVEVGILQLEQYLEKWALFEELHGT